MRMQELMLLEVQVAPHPREKGNPSSRFQRRGSVSSLSSIGSASRGGDADLDLDDDEEDVYETNEAARWSFNQTPFSEHPPFRTSSPPSPVKHRRRRPHTHKRMESFDSTGSQDSFEPVRVRETNISTNVDTNISRSTHTATLDVPPSYASPSREHDDGRDGYGNKFFGSIQRFSRRASLGPIASPQTNKESRWSFAFNKANMPPPPVEASPSTASSADRLGGPPQRRSSLICSRPDENPSHQVPDADVPNLEQHQQLGKSADQGQRLIDIIQKLSIRAAMALTRSNQYSEEGAS